MSRSICSLLTGVLIIAAFSCSHVVLAQTIWVAGGTIGQNTGVLGTMTPTGVFSLVGATSTQLSGIAFSPTGVLYGVSADATTLFTIDAATGGLTRVGSTGLRRGLADGLAFRADGALFMANEQSNLYTLDPGTGAASLVGPIGNQSTGTIGFDDSGNLYESNNDSANGANGLDTLVILDQATGAARPLSNLGFNTNYSSIFGLAFANGALFGFVDVDHAILSLDTATGLGTQIGAYSLPDNQIVLAATSQIVPAAPAVPEPSMFAFLSCFVLTGAAFLRRHKRAR